MDVWSGRTRARSTSRGGRRVPMWSVDVGTLVERTDSTGPLASPYVTTGLAFPVSMTLAAAHGSARVCSLAGSMVSRREWGVVDHH